MSGMVRTCSAQPLPPLSDDLRWPDAAEALRLLDASRAIINVALTALWSRLDAFTAERSAPAWNQVDALFSSPELHGSRQWRCEAEVVGRILRAQAERTRLFALVLPLLSAGVQRPQRRGPASPVRDAARRQGAQRHR